MKTLSQTRNEAKNIIESLKAMVMDNTLPIEKRREAKKDMMKHQVALLKSYK